jgi:hypothetical protein
MISLRNFYRSVLAAPRLSARGWRWLLLAVPLLLAAAGCASWNWRGRGFDDDSGGWAKNLRPEADEKQFSGLDARAQQIERNLGVR